MQPDDDPFQATIGGSIQVGLIDETEKAERGQVPSTFGYKG